MKMKQFLLIIVVLAGLSACNQQTSKNEEQSNVKYYRQMLFSETPWDLERGSYPISADDAKTVNNYKFTWNDDGTLATVEYNRNGVLLGYSNLRAAKITYTYEGNKQIKHFFDEDGNPIENNKVFAFEYTVDNGMRTALRFLDKNGQEVENGNNIHNYVWSKLDDNMIRELRYNLAGEKTVMNPFCPFYELRFSYNPSGFVTRMANYEDDTLYNCTAENCGDIGVSYFLFKNNPNGDVLSFSVHNTVGQLSNLYWGWAKRLNTVDENGNPVEVKVYDQDDELLSGKGGIPVTKNEYDEHGAVVRSSSLDADNNLINNPNNGVAVVEYKYDEQGKRVETLRFDKDMNPVENNG